MLSIVKLFKYYKSLGDKTLARLDSNELNWVHNDNNSIATIIQHLHGNMLSRWTHFLQEDGEKPWRKRDEEFQQVTRGKEELQELWQSGWQCLFSAIEPLDNSDLKKVVYIRNQGHTVSEALERQLGHYAYHVGQMVLLGKMILGTNWESLSIPKNQSNRFNKKHFEKTKQKKHFTDKSENK